jgi:hypothetical protein
MANPCSTIANKVSKYSYPSTYISPVIKKSFVAYSGCSAKKTCREKRNC